MPDHTADTAQETHVRAPEAVGTPLMPVTTNRTLPRLSSVDGLRAFAALWVVLFHIRAFSGARLPFGLDTFVRSGSTGVSLFLVLSGFCLYVPFAAGRDGRFGVRSFLTRRCKRLMPAYYTSLILILGVYVVARGHLGLAAFTEDQLTAQAVSHVTLTHQLFPSTFYGLNGAYWSLGLEWELYLTLPLLILAIRRLGLYRTVAVVIGVNVAYRLVLAGVIGVGALHANSPLAADVLPNLFVGRWGEFALGMLAAELYSRDLIRSFAVRWWWTAIPAAVLGFAAPSQPVAHVVFGYVFFVLLSFVLAGGNPVHSIFACRPLVVVGVMSYSLYLVHQPLVEIEASLLHRAGTRPTFVLICLLVSIPGFLAVALALFLAVERRTLRAAPSGTQPRGFMSRAGSTLVGRGVGQGRIRIRRLPGYRGLPDPETGVA